MALTAKQARFVAEYLKDGNATQSAIRAGYSSATAYSIGNENLSKPEIASAIQVAQDAMTQATIADAKERREVLSGLLRNGDVNPKARIQALDVLNKMDGLYVSKHEIGGVNGGPIQVNVTPADARL